MRHEGNIAVTELRGILYSVLLSLILLFSILPLFNTTLGQSTGKATLRIHSDHFTGEECNKLAGLPRDGRIQSRDLNAITERLLKALALRGYPLARVHYYEQSLRQGRKYIDLHIADGAPFAGRIQLHGAEDLELSAISGQTINLIDSEIITGYSSQVLENLTDNGFPFAVIIIEPNIIDYANDTISSVLNMRIKKGDFMRINDVRFPGRKYTDRRILFLESRLNRGDPFSRSNLNQAVASLQKLEYIRSVSQAELYPAGPGIVDIRIPVVDQPANRISGLLALNPQDNTPTGELRFAFGNLMGTGRKLGFSWTGLNPARKGIEVYYLEPWIFDFPLSLETGLEQWNEDTLGSLTRYNFKTQWEPVRQYIFGGAVSFEEINRRINSETQTSLKTVWFEGNATLNFLDHDWNPAAGFRVSTMTAFGLRRGGVLKRNTKYVRRDRLSVEYAKEVLRHWVIFNRSALNDVSGDDIGLEELNMIGGKSSVRGYAEERRKARGAAWNNLELRWRPDRYGYVGLFVDFGWIYRTDPRIDLDEDFLGAFGLTGVFMTKAGQIGIDLGLARGEPIEQARLHLKVNTWF